jgi:POT family proton-dependent oligopeptide transporter
MIPALDIENGGARISILWSFAYALVNNIGFANIMPVGLALYSRAAPRGLQGVMIGIYYLHLFFGNSFVGWLAGLLETMPGSQFWMLHAALVAAAGVGLLAVKLVFGRLLAPEAEPVRRS